MIQTASLGSAERAWGDTTFPKPGKWVLDPAHTTVEFEARHLMVAKVKGRFAEFEGTLHIADDPNGSSAAVTIKAGSIDTRTQQRDDHLRSADFLEVEKYPDITFVSTGVEHGGGRGWRITGDLTIHGVSRPVVLEAEYNGQTGDPWGGQRAFFSAETKIDREDWGLVWNEALETGGWLVGKEITIRLEVEAVLRAE